MVGEGDLVYLNVGYWWLWIFDLCSCFESLWILNGHSCFSHMVEEEELVYLNFVFRWSRILLNMRSCFSPELMPDCWSRIFLNAHSCFSHQLMPD